MPGDGRQSAERGLMARAPAAIASTAARLAHRRTLTLRGRGRDELLCQLVPRGGASLAGAGRAGRAGRAGTPRNATGSRGNRNRCSRYGIDDTLFARRRATTVVGNDRRFIFSCKEQKE